MAAHIVRSGRVRPERCGIGAGRSVSNRHQWIAAGFIVGSSLFALGALPGYATAVGVSASAFTFFLGSLFFTAAGFLQYREAVDGLPDRHDRRRKVWVSGWSDPNWLACLVQLAGTLWFNWSTGNALQHNLTAAVSDTRIWRPDALGSAAFLVASAIAWIAEHRDAIRARHRARTWWIATVNLLGSIAFGVSAVTAYVVPATDDIWDAQLSNLGTFVGALCFLAGAILLLPRPTPESH
jgi:hypothetical protein